MNNQANPIHADPFRGAIYRIGQAFNNEMRRLTMLQRRELLIKAMEGIRQQVALIDENTRRNQQAEQLAAKAAAASTSVEFGKGSRSSDAIVNDH